MHAMEATTQYRLTLVIYKINPRTLQDKIVQEVRCHVTALSEHEARRKALDRAHADGLFIDKFIKIERRSL
jgi:hypothetical protein